MKKIFFNVLIIGCGRVGAFFDDPEDKNILTHSHAYYSHPNFELVGFVDSNYKKAKKAAEIWGGKAYHNLDEAFKNNEIDIVVNATPDKEHFNILKKLLKKQIKLILTEKPITTTLAEAKKIVALAETNKTDIAINYRRCFVPDFIKLKQEIGRGIYGDYLTGTGYYGKGFLHNGSHLINLLMFLIGDIKKIIPIHWQYDYLKADPSLSGVLYLKNEQPFFIQSVDSRLYTIFEIDLVFSKARIRITDSGFKIEYYRIKNDPIFPGYRNMKLFKTTKTKLSKSLYYVADNIYNHLQNKTKLGCTLSEGYKTAETIFDVLVKNHQHIL